MTLPAVPAVSLAGKPVTTRVEAAAALTTIFVSLAVRFCVVVAVIDCVPTVSSVTAKLCVPPSPAPYV